MGDNFRFQFLGPVKVERDGEPVQGFESRKALALLGYLAVQGQPVSRDRLVNLLWGDKSESRGRANLSWVLHKISSLLPNCLQADWHTVGFQRTEEHRLDLDAFEALDARGDTAALAAAARLYRGEFLEGLYLDGCAEFEIWLLREQERWRQRVARVLDRLVAHHAQRGQHEPGLRYARRLLTLEPWREETHRQMMLILARGGQHSAALAQYKACRKALAQELGVEPAWETTALYERIRDAGSTGRHNLPAQPTPLVGREKELAQATRMLCNPDCRLVTVIGPGGIGKTRLALQAAAVNGSIFLDGVYYISLASVGSTSAFVSAVANALGLSFHGGQAPQTQLADYLREKELLLLLDDLAQLPEATDLLSYILERASQAKLLVTTRERLNLRWEWLLEVQGLAYPQGNETLDELRTYSAVQLFLQSARWAFPGFFLSEQNAHSVARICRLVEGMPREIELAAAWTREFSCHEIAREIERNLDFLRTSARDAPHRRRSLRAVFYHSWRLLSEEKRAR